MKQRICDEQYYETAYLSWQIKIGTISQPSIKHNQPADYGLTDEEAIKIRLKCLKIQANDLKDEYSAVKRQYLQGKREFAYIALNSIQARLDKVGRNINFLKARLRGDTAHQPFDLEALKKVPIASITKVNANGFFQVNPFRQENSPSNSLFLYRKDNRAHDFGSGKSYDAIDVFMAVNQCDFKTACKEIQI